MANLYDLKRFDLNLLVIFECIYQQLSISKAAEMLFITPSAVSQSLQRLRTQLNDPLFIRAGKGITPTTVATNLHYHLADNFNSLEKTINMMNNTELKKRFVIYGPQFYCSPKFSQLMELLIAKPDLQVEYYNYETSQESIEDLLNFRKADMVLSLAPVNSRALVCQHFLTLNATLVCRKDHPRLGDTATVEEALQEKFTFFITKDPSVTHYQTNEDYFYAHRQYAFYSPSIMSIINTISHTDIVGMLPRPTYEVFKDAFGLKEVIIPTPLAEFNYYMTYNRSMLSTEIFNEIITKLGIQQSDLITNSNI